MDIETSQVGESASNSTASTTSESVSAQQKPDMLANTSNLSNNNNGNSSNSMLVDSGSSTDLGRGAASSPAMSSSTNSGLGTSAVAAALGGSLSGGDAGTGAVGEQFLQLAKSAKGAAAVQLIKEALEAPGLYVFAELLHMPNIKELSSSPEHSAYYRLVEVFAYGVYDDYLNSTPALPPLSPRMLTKLRHLTIVTMATTHKTLPLDTLVKKLGLDSQRDLEDLIIEAIYSDVLHGKLDQKNSVLEVDYALGRDIKLKDLPHIAATLKAWCDSCNGLLGSLEGLVTSANRDKEASIRRANHIEAEATKIKNNFKRQAGGGADGGEDGISQTDSIRDGGEKKLHRLKKSGPGQPGTSSSGAAKPTAKFWPKS